MFKRQQQSELTIGLDIGSTAVRVAVGQYIPGTGRKNSLQIMGAVEVSSEGVHRGVVTSIEEVVSSVSNALEEAERMVGVPIESAWVGVTGNNTLFQGSKGVIAVAKTNGEIAPEDVGRAVEAAQMVASPLNYEVLHVMPKRFSVDGQTGIKDPVGMTGIRLEVDTQIIYGLIAHLKNITKAVYRTGIDINDLVVSIFAIGNVVTTSRQKELGVIVADIGASTTSIVVYEEGDVVHMAVLPIGSEHVTNDIALGLRTSIDVAEKLKIDYGSCVIDARNKKEILDLVDVGAPNSEIVSKHYLSEIINARVGEILEKINKELHKIKRSALLPSGIIFTGGGSKIRGLVELAKEDLRLPASLGYPLDLESVSEKSSDISFATAVGLCAWGAESSQKSKVSKTKIISAASGKFAGQVQKIFKMLIP